MDDKYILRISPGTVITVGPAGLTIYSDSPINIDGGHSNWVPPPEESGEVPGA